MYGTTLVGQLLDAADTPDTLPYRFQVCRPSRTARRAVREMPCGDYRIDHRVRERHAVVEVVMVRHGAQRPPTPFPTQWAPAASHGHHQPRRRQLVNPRQLVVDDRRPGRLAQPDAVVGVARPRRGHAVGRSYAQASSAGTMWPTEREVRVTIDLTPGTHRRLVERMATRGYTSLDETIKSLLEETADLPAGPPWLEGEPTDEELDAALGEADRTSGIPVAQVKAEWMAQLNIELP